MKIYIYSHGRSQLWGWGSARVVSGLRVEEGRCDEVTTGE